MRPSTRAASIVPLDVVAADHVEDEIGALAAGRLLGLVDEILGLVVDRAIARRACGRPRHFSSEPTVVMTRAPKAVASWIAVVPMPEEPPWISTVSPAFKPPRSNTLCQTVKKVSGMAAASTS